MYFVLAEKPLGSSEDLAVIDRTPRVPGIRTWMLGQKFTVKIEEPLVFEMSEVYTGRIPDFFRNTIPLFSDRLVSALHEVGVESFDVYRAQLINSKGLVSDQYWAVNIIGVVAAADITRSILAPGAAPTLIDTSFDSLVVDETQTKGALMFRLAENLGAILVHECVKDGLTKRGFGSLGFIEPKDWMSI